MQKGKIIEWNDAQGYGFIAVKNETKDIFFHISEVSNKDKRPKVHDKVSLTIAKCEQNKLSAKNVNIERRPIISSALLLALLVIVALFSASIYFKNSTIILFVYIAMSVVTYASYAFDKNASIKGKRRTPENSLHLLSLCCGWPGALIAQKRLRHKTQKQPFQFIFWATAFINSMLLFWLV